MFDPRYPWMAVGVLAAAASVVVVYYGAITSGLYKDPLMARFRAYGPERRTFPLCRFLEALGAWSLLIASLLDALTARHRSGTLFAPVLFLALSGLALAGALAVRQHPGWRAALPAWYDALLRSTTREERRQLGYAWTRIPRRLRWRLSGDRASFRVWTDMVRLTAVYGARGATDSAAAWQ